MSPDPKSMSLMRAHKTDVAAVPVSDVAAAAADLLVWYDRHRRSLPWRALAGETADPYTVWLSEIMLQQTTVAAVKPYFTAFLARWPTITFLIGVEHV